MLWFSLIRLLCFIIPKISTGYLGTPVEMYNSKGEKTWQVEYDIYEGKA